MWNTAVKKRAGDATNAPARDTEGEASMQAERTEQEQLEQQLRETVRKLIAAGEARIDIEGMVVQELLRDD